jgi:uncharacterized membrane protein (UPF0127 family)
MGTGVNVLKKLTNKTQNVEIANDVRLAKTFIERTVGLIGVYSMPKDFALWIQGSRFIPCNSIHTFFMRFAIDVVFVDRELKVKAIYRNVRPWRVTPVVKGAWSVLEFRGGALSSSIEVGDQLHVGA